MMYIGYREVFGIHKMKNILLVFFLCMSFQISTISASTQTLLLNEKEEVSNEKMNFFEEMEYRIIYKDTKDFFDYVIFGTAVVALLIVMVFQNTHYVIIRRPIEQENFLEESNNYTIEEVEKEIVEEESLENSEVLSSDLLEVEEKTENPEILSSDLLVEEEEKPMKKNKPKKRRA